MCKTCKTTIDEGLVRVGTTISGLGRLSLRSGMRDCAGVTSLLPRNRSVDPMAGDYDMTSWRHIWCQKRPAGLSQSDVGGLDALLPDDIALVTAWVNGSTAVLDDRKRQALASAASAGSGPSTPPRKKVIMLQGSNPPPEGCGHAARTLR